MKNYNPEYKQKQVDILTLFKKLCAISFSQGYSSFLLIYGGLEYKNNPGKKMVQTARIIVVSL